MKKCLVILSILGLGTGCVSTPPISEYNIADISIEYAKKSEAPLLASALWHEADESYSKAQRLYDERSFEEAQKYFIKAIKFAERAENMARLKKSNLQGE